MLSTLSIIIVLFLQLSSARNNSLSKNYKFVNQNLVLADTSFNNKTLFYALYTQSSKQCSVIQEINPFTNSTVTRKCNFAIKADGVQLIVAFGTEKAILITQEVTPNLVKLKAITVHMDGCKTIDEEFVDVPLNWSNRKLYHNYIDVVASEQGFEVIIKGLSYLCTKPDAEIYCSLSFDADGKKIEGPLIWPKMAYDKIDIISPVMTDASGQGYFFVNRDSSLLAFQLNRKGGPRYVKLWYTPIEYTNLWREGYSVENKVDGMCYNVNSIIGCWQTDHEGELKINMEFEFDHKFKANIKQCNTTLPSKIQDSATPVIKILDTTAQIITIQATTIQFITVQETTIEDVTTQETTVVDATSEDATVTESMTQKTIEVTVMESITVEGITEKDTITLNNTRQVDTVNFSTIKQDLVQDNITSDGKSTESNTVQNSTEENVTTPKKVMKINAFENNTTQDSAIQETITTDIVTLDNSTEDKALMENSTDFNTVQDIAVQDLKTQTLIADKTVTQKNIAAESTIPETIAENATLQDITGQEITVQDITTQKNLVRRSLSQIESTKDEHKIWNLFIHNLRNHGFIILIVTCPKRICSGNEDHYYLMKINSQGKLYGQLEVNIKSKCNAEKNEVFAKVFENDQGQYCLARLCKSKQQKSEQLEIIVNCYCNSDFK